MNYDAAVPFLQYDSIDQHHTDLLESWGGYHNIVTLKGHIMEEENQNKP